MKRKIGVVLFWAVLACLSVLAACGSGGEKNDHGTLSIADVTVMRDKEADIVPVFSDESKAENVTYSFEGNNISITDGKVTGLVANTDTIVTAKTEHHTATFKVTVTQNYGTLSLNDVSVTFGQEYLLNPVFSDEAFAEDVRYAFDGHDIAIDDGLLTGLVPDTETTVTATTAHHSATFKVKVNYVTATLTDPNGDESKFAVPTPKDTDKYVVTAKVNVELFRENGWTRIGAFAFNGSDNSWYNIELTEAGDAILYARFNGVEKYGITLFNINDEGVLENGKFSYTVALLRNGQETKFYINDELACAFTADEMEGYDELGALEVTAAANRANAGEYKAVISELFYQTENSDAYKRYASAAASTIIYDDVTLEAEDGTERKFYVGIPDIKLGSKYVFSATVTVNEYDPDLTRLAAFAFNGSDNSWYNIEMNSAGDATLYGRFNGVEKYHIHLFNKADDGIVQNEKITFTVNILKQGQSTFFFFNGKPVCAFSEAELNGYGKLAALEITAATDVWADRGAYSVTLSGMKAENAESETFTTLEALTHGIVYDDATLTNADGGESKFALGNIFNVYRDFVYTATVTVNQYRNAGWTRPTAFAFNGSDNSWYNIEMGADGQLTLYARFNGVEKYGIPLFNINDEGILSEGKFSYTVAILKKGQSTHFFINGKLVCSFSDTELAGYAPLATLEVTAAANRDDAGEYNIALSDQKIETPESDAFAAYDSLANAE